MAPCPLRRSRRAIRLAGRGNSPSGGGGLPCPAAGCSSARPSPRRWAAPTPSGCATGTLTVTGSTAFAPAAEKRAESYESACPDSDVTVEPHGSTAGIRALDAASAKAASSGGSPSVITFSDGPKPNGYSELRENPVAVSVSVFTLVVNDRVTVQDLSLTDVRKIYRGEIRNWQDVGGPDLLLPGLPYQGRPRCHGRSVGNSTARNGC